MTIAAFVTAAAQLIFFWNFFRSLRNGVRASANPWNATTLEWITASPPPADNFGGQFPSVYRGPYEYSVPGEAADFLPQNLAPEGGVRTNAGAAGIPQRAYLTGTIMLLAGVLMFFMALVSADIVRQGFSSDWRPIDLPWRVLLLSTAILLASSFTLARSRSRLLANDDAGIPALVGRHGDSRSFLSRGTRDRLAPARGRRNWPGDKPRQQLLLRFHGRARGPRAGRNCGHGRGRIPSVPAI